jgi:hypothetical protein
VDDQVKKNEIRRVYNTYERNERCIQNFSRKTVKGRDYSVDLNVNGRVISNRSEGNSCVAVNWIHLAQNRDK